MGFRRRDREKKEYQAAAQQLAGKFKVDDEALKAEYARKQEVAETFQRDTQATEAATPRPSSRSTSSSRRSSAGPRRPRRRPAGRRWRSSRGPATRGSSGGGRPRPTGRSRSRTCTSARRRRRSCSRGWAGWRWPPPRRRRRSWRKRDAAGAGARRRPTADPEATRPTPMPPSRGRAGPPPPRRGQSPVPPPGRPDPDRGRDHRARRAEAPPDAQISNLILPFLLLGGGVAAGLVFGAGSAGPSAASPGASSAVAGVIGGWLGLGSMARPQVLRHAVPLRKPLADAEQVVEQNKEWVKNEFERSSRSSRTGGPTRSARPRRPWPASSPRPRPRRREQHKAADVKYPPQVEQIRVRRDEQSEEGRGRLPAPDRGAQGEVRQGQAGARRVVPQDQEATQQAYNRTWEALIDDWTGGMGGSTRRCGGVNERGLAAVPRLDAARARRLEAAGGGPPGPAVRRLRRGPKQFPHGIPVDPRLKSVPTHFDLPALIPFPILCSMLIRAADAGKDQAVPLLQALMLRFLTSIPRGQGPVHHHRPGRPGRELRRLHAPGRLPRAAGHQPDLDRADPHRAAADRPDRAHGERHPEVPAQRVRDDRGIQHHGRRGRRAVPRGGRRQLPDQLQRQRACRGW